MVLQLSQHSANGMTVVPTLLCVFGIKFLQQREGELLLLFV